MQKGERRKENPITPSDKLEYAREYYWKNKEKILKRMKEREADPNYKVNRRRMAKRLIILDIKKWNEAIVEKIELLKERKRKKWLVDMLQRQIKTNNDFLERYGKKDDENGRRV